MGKNPVLFLPTHRSYADFCLMTYLCYHYDIDLPAVAAGMGMYTFNIFFYLILALRQYNLTALTH